MIEQTAWRGLPAFRLRSDEVAVVIVPERGAKIASLVDRTQDKEWLVCPGHRPVEAIPFASEWSSADMSGWDEMFPTINACAYPAPGAFHGRPLPDHGEVWALPWSAEVSGDALMTTVEGRTLPYALHRRAAVTADVLRLDYEVRNTGEHELATLWAAHPLFVAGAETRIVLPEHVAEVVGVYDEARGWDAAGWLWPWPQGLDRPLPLDRVGPVSTAGGHKFYAPPDAAPSWAALQDDADGTSLRLDWDPAIVPYLGVWVDEGLLNTAANVALEPATGYYDELTRAWTDDRSLRLPAGSTVAWTLTVRLGCARR